MINQQITSNTTKAASYSQTGEFALDKSFYETVRSDFLQQSARYLRESFSIGRSVSYPSKD